MSEITEKILSQSSHWAQLRGFIKEDPVDGWDKAWQHEVTPWDAGEAQPLLRSLLASGGLDLPATGKALVPGCGRGYDALTIASELGYETLAIDVSPVAVDIAKHHSASAKVKLEIQDFSAENGPYDLIYDYTEWGHQMTALVKSGGYLVTLLFPIIDQPEGMGPPFRARPEDYVEALGDSWQKVLDKVPMDSLPTHQEIERLLVWKGL
ncbi:S-adenosyl-L-methionine-dependent methyltransferase [Fomitopsis serialis]|uniref:S-adenosyl-L-methionine-dependent methyltransferase n=1 Tax=Fomitopsis serialis TaxID=139415 RepID=UPI0020088BD1|nr:S-adenosyl-L-methionine-dependent methyltransferase [Neoantrodia serialis]KAH9938414.1 S-adenosyl-L-methionine-dependent methyltransferase [Neoantrodia serialis]